MIKYLLRIGGSLGLRTLVLGPVVGVSCLISLAVIGVMVATLYQRAKEELTSRGLAIAHGVCQVAETAPNEVSLQRFVAAMSSEAGVKLIIVAAGEPLKVVAASRQEWLGLEAAQLSDPEHAYHELRRFAQTNHSKIEFAHDHQASVDITIPLRTRFQTEHPLRWSKGAVMLHIDGGPQMQQLTFTTTRIIATLLLISLGATAIGYALLTRFVLKPMGQIANVVKLTALGDRTARVHNASKNELGQLAAHIDAMLDELVSRENFEADTIREAIDAQQRIQATVEELERTKSALDQHAIISVTDASGIITEVNDKFCEISMYQREELLGRSHRVINSGQHPPAFWQDLWRTITAGNIWRGQICNRAKDGSLYWVQTAIVPALGADGSIEKFVSIRFDVTAQKHAESAAALAARQLDAQLDAIDRSHGRIEFSINGQIVDANNNFLQWIQYAREELVGQPHQVLFPADSVQASLQPDFWEALCGGRYQSGEFRLVARDGSHRWIQASYNPVVSVDGSIEKIVKYAFDITDRKRAEAELAVAQKQLQEQQLRFERAIAGTSDGLWDFDPATGNVWYSDQFKRLIGLAEAEFATFLPELASLTNILHPLDKDAALEAFEGHLRDDRPFDVKYRLKLPNGEYRWFRARGRSIRDAAGHPIRTSGSITDVHEQHTAESRLVLATQSAKIGMWDWDIPSATTYFSDTWYAMLGYAAAELPMNVDTWKALIHPHDLTATLADVERHLLGETELYENVHRLRKRDGSWLWIRDAGQVVERFADGTPKRMIGVHIDISEMQEAKTRLEMALSAAKAGLWDWMIPTNTVVSNDSFHTMVGEEPARRELSIDYFVSRLHPADAEHVWREVAKCHASDDYHYDVEFRFRCADGSYKWIRSTGAVIERDEAGRPLRMIGQHLDIQRSKEILEQATAANRSKSEFLANMSHEIRTPMTAILGYVDLLDSEGECALEPQQSAEAIKTIRSNAQHLLQLINDILDLSKIEAGKMTIESIPTNPMQIAESVAELVRPRAQGKGIALSVRIDSLLPEQIMTDPIRLRQILLNLVGNAIKFTEVGGVTIHLDCEPNSHQLRFRIADTGIGMTDDQRAAVARFDAFSQADGSLTRKYGGSGLGLCISNCFAQMLGGNITVDSQIGMGSTFTLTIATGSLHDTPFGDYSRTSATPPLPAVQSLAHNPRPLEGLRLLLAEDGPDNQRLISFIFKKAGAHVTVAENGRLAIHRFEEALGTPAAFDVIVMDMQMPELDGYEATAELRAKGYSVPIIALTAHAMAGDRERCLAAGCDDYATKPIDRPQLLALIASYRNSTSGLALT